MTTARAGRMITAAAVALVALSGCGSSGSTYEVAGTKVTVKDVGYDYTSTRFCEALAQEQIKIRMVEYSPICGSTSANAKDPTAEERNEIHITLAIGGHPNNTLPYNLAKVNCTVGGAANGIAELVHFPAAATTPDSRIQADEGTVYLQSYDPEGKKTAKGTFALTFSSQKIEGTFDAVACN